MRGSILKPGAARVRERVRKTLQHGLGKAQSHRAYDPVVKGLAWTGLVLVVVAVAWLLWIITFGGIFMIPGVVAFAGLTVVWFSLRRGGWSGALRRLERRADSGNPEACFQREMACLGGHLGLPRDPVTAQAWIFQAAQAGHPGAMLKRSELLAWGLAGPRDSAGAEAWKEAAAEAKTAGVRP